MSNQRSMPLWYDIILSYYYSVMMFKCLGRKSITVESDCPNVDYSEDFSQPCLIDLDNDGCPCNSDVDFTDPPCVHIEELREQGPCRFIEHISDWKALAYNCLMEQGGTCDGMVDCVPDSCTPEKR